MNKNDFETMTIALNKSRKRNDTFYAASMGVIILTFTLCCVLGFLAFYPYKPLVIKNNPIEVLDPVVEPGGVVRHKYDVCINNDVPVRIQKEIVNGFHVALSPVDARPGIMCGEIITSTKIPDFMPEGTYYITMSGTMKVNPIRDITIKWRTQEFKVVE